MGAQATIRHRNCDKPSLSACSYARGRLTKMAHLSDKGTHCSDPYCRMCDFLPFKCDGCDKVFCKDHFAYDAHDCPGAKAKDRRVIVCPLCTKTVPHPAGAPSVGAVKPKCPVKGCKEKL